MPISGDLKSWDFFPDQYPPPPDRICQCDPPRKIFSDSDSLSPSPPPAPHRSTSREKRGSIYQGLQTRNRNTSIRSQMILKFWNKRRLNCSFLWATVPNFLLSGSFGHPCGRAGDSRTILESWHICKLSWWNRWLHTIVLLCICNSSIRSVSSHHNI